MTFLAMIIALSLHQVIQPDSYLQRDAWLFQWDRWVAARLPTDLMRVLVTLGVIAAALLWVFSAIEGWLFGLVDLLATAGLFVWSLGRGDFHTALERYEAKIAHDPAAACAALDCLWAPLDDEPESVLSVKENQAGPDDENVDENDEESDPAKRNHQTPDPLEAAESDQDRALQRLAYSGYARWFAPLFYFALAGPLAAVMYRVLSSLAEDNRSPLYLQWLRWLDWAPARVLGLTFALSGDFMAVSKRAPLAHFADVTPAPQLLWELAVVACNNSDGARAIGDILYRSAGLWLLGLSAVMIFG
ncbi:regulatory signaling modulator protein AmpE [Congregibacter sp.]|uniref:regulatory signaling modulator protein AmpE n=1 Tax=Congregibacter sp. TaxID=2744308 RepID=UPI003F6A7DE9